MSKAQARKKVAKNLEAIKVWLKTESIQSIADRLSMPRTTLSQILRYQYGFPAHKRAGDLKESRLVSEYDPPKGWELAVQAFDQVAMQ